MASTLRSAALGAFLLAGVLASPLGLADQPSKPQNSPNGKTTDPGAPLTPRQIVSEFTQLPADTQKALMKILMSSKSKDEKKMSGSDIDAAYASLPPDVQKSLYAKWDALSDEQRVALKGMNPGMIKEMLGSAVKEEISQQTKSIMAPVQKAIEKGTTMIKEAGTFVKKWFSRIFGSGKASDQPAESSP
jgi:hypothetical protein